MGFSLAELNRIRRQRDELLRAAAGTNSLSAPATHPATVSSSTPPVQSLQMRLPPEDHASSSIPDEVPLGSTHGRSVENPLSQHEKDSGQKDIAVNKESGNDAGGEAPGAIGGLVGRPEVPSSPPPVVDLDSDDPDDNVPLHELATRKKRKLLRGGSLDEGGTVRTSREKEIREESGEQSSVFMQKLKVGAFIDRRVILPADVEFMRRVPSHELLSQLQFSGLSVAIAARELALRQDSASVQDLQKGLKELEEQVKYERSLRHTAEEALSKCKEDLSRELETLKKAHDAVIMEKAGLSKENAILEQKYNASEAARKLEGEQLLREREEHVGLEKKLSEAVSAKEFAERNYDLLSARFEKLEADHKATIEKLEVDHKAKVDELSGRLQAAEIGIVSLHDEGFLKCRRQVEIIDPGFDLSRLDITADVQDGQWIMPPP